MLGCSDGGGDGDLAKPTDCHGKNAACPPPPPPPPPTGTGTGTLHWDASFGATGYILHYGFATGAYASVVDVGNALTYTLGPFSVGQTLYVAVSAYNSAGESPLSSEVSKTL